MKQIFINLPVSDIEKSESIAMVNEMIENGLNAGGIEPVPSLDEGFMFLRTIEDLDGFTWGVMFLDLDKFKASS